MIHAVLAVPLLLAAPARAGDDWAPPVTDPVVQKECGSCHMAFQPAFLPARSWRVMMGTLRDHFGDNASVSEDKVRHITAYLEANAGDTARRGLGPDFMRRIAPTASPQRITETPEFVREHRKVSAHAWQRPGVVTKSNCVACHPGAEQGYYDDD
ncbi:MAG: diheme cytochrome c [Rhodospirillaceae bacterium]